MSFFMNKRTQQINELTEENELLEAELKDLRHLPIEELLYKDGECKVFFDYTNNKYFQAMLMIFTDMYKNHGGENYLTFSYSDNRDGEMYECTIRRKFGLTPSDKVAKLEEEIVELKKQLEAK